MAEGKDDLHALLERAAKLMVKAGYSAIGVRIKVAGKEKGYVFMESSVYMKADLRFDPNAMGAQALRL